MEFYEKAHRIYVCLARRHRPESRAGARAGQAPLRRDGYAPVNGLRVYYEVHGRARSGMPPLVLLHGGGSTIETTFGRVLASLAKSREVIAFEQQGHGRTADIAGRPFTFEQSADDTAALLHHLDIARADPFGFSNGGHIALCVAIRHPLRVRKLIVASAGVTSAGHDPEFWEFMERTTFEEMPGELREAYLKRSPHPEQLCIFFEKSAARMREFKDFSAWTKSYRTSQATQWYHCRQRADNSWRA